MAYEQYKVANPVVEILELDESKITKFYVGKDHCCRCGCGGAYYHDPNNRMWKGELTKFRRMLQYGCIREVEIEEMGKQWWINAAYGSKEQNRCFCFYFNKI